jgi:hypothetical protein
MASRGEDVRDIAITVPPIGSPAEIKVAIGIPCKTCDQKMTRTAHISPQRTMFFIKQFLGTKSVKAMGRVIFGFSNLQPKATKSELLILLGNTCRSRQPNPLVAKGSGSRKPT